MARHLVEASRTAAGDHARTVLLVAYHFPPLLGSSGMQRTLRFAQHLPRYGWRPLVLTIHPRAYEATGPSAGNEVPPDLQVHRAFGLNAATHLSVFGRYPNALALPDRWATWRLWAVPKALRIIRMEQVSAVWTTFPIATAHRIGVDLARRTRLPWIAEFRDPMWQSDWPPEPQANLAWRKLEREIFGTADWAVFTAPSAVTMYAERFPAFDRSRLVVIENGYDEESFARAERSLAERRLAEPIGCAGSAVTETSRPRPTTLLHSGIIYRSERDPSQFFAAVAALKSKGLIAAADLRILLRASGGEADYRSDLDRLGIADIVSLEPGIPYIAALSEMLTVDGLLLLQAANCNAQIPAKLYEYLRAGRPVLALTDPEGDTAKAVESTGAGRVARLDDATEIESQLLQFLSEVRLGRASRATPQTAAQYSRAAKAGELAALLDHAVSAARRRA